MDVKVPLLGSREVGVRKLVGVAAWSAALIAVATHLTADLREVVDRTMQPAHVSVWTVTR